MLNKLCFKLGLFAGVFELFLFECLFKLGASCGKFGFKLCLALGKFCFNLCLALRQLFAELRLMLGNLLAC